MDNRSLAEVAQLDLGKLQGPTNHVYVLQWLEGLEDRVSKASESEAGEAYPAIHRSLSSLWRPASNATGTAPRNKNEVNEKLLGHPTRQSIGRIYAALYAKRGTAGLVELLQEWARVFSDAKLQVRVRTLAIQATATILSAHAAQIASQHHDLCVALLKVARSTSNPTLLRHEALACLSVLLPAGASLLSENTIRDCLKSFKTLLHDKADIVQRGSAAAITQLFQAAPSLHTRQDLEQSLTAALRAFAACSWELRRVLVDLVASLLLLTQLEKPHSARADNAHTKPGGSAAEDQEEDMAFGGAAARSLKALFTLDQALDWPAEWYNNPTTSKGTRNAIVEIYFQFLARLGSDTVELHFAAVFDHLLLKIGAGPQSQTNRQEMLLARRYMGTLLQELIERGIIREAAQLAALREIVERYLPQPVNGLPTSNDLPPSATVIVLETVMLLIHQFGQTSVLLTDARTSAAVMALSSHPDYAVRCAAARALSALTACQPSTITATVSKLSDTLSNTSARLTDLSSAGEADQSLMSTVSGCALAISAQTVLFVRHPSYTSLDLSARIISIAMDLLKIGSKHTPGTSLVLVEAAWTILAGLMVLGPPFVRVHLPQLLILWKNAFPRSSTRDATVTESKSFPERRFLLCMRTAAMGCLRTFLRFNLPDLLSADVSRRFAALLNHAFSLLHTVQPKGASAHKEVSSETGSTTTDSLLKQHLLACYSLLIGNREIETTRTNILQFCIQQFCPSRSSEVSVDHHPPASPESPPSWLQHDMYGTGTTTLLQDDVAFNAGAPISDLRAEEAIQWRLERLLRCHGLRSVDHDFLEALLHGHQGLEQFEPSLAVINTAITVYGQWLPTLHVEERRDLLLRMLQNASSLAGMAPSQCSPEVVNTILAIRTALASLSADKRRSVRPCTEQESEALARFLHRGLESRDPVLRLVAAEGLASLCTLQGATFLASQIQHGISTIVSNTDPVCRAGNAVMFAQAYHQVGTMVASPVLKVITDVLLSLCTDPHPVVHYWSLRSLAKVIDSAGPDYSPFVNTALGAMANIYLLESHDPHDGLGPLTRLKGNWPALQALAAVLDALAGVIGPTSTETGTSLHLLTVLIKLLIRGGDVAMEVVASYALQHCLVLSPDAIPAQETIRLVQHQLAARNTPLRMAAISAVYQLVQRKVGLMSTLGGDNFVKRLFALLDEDPSIPGIQETIRSWLFQTSLINPCGWISLCEGVMNKSFKKTARSAQASLLPLHVEEDEEAQGLGTDLSESATASVSSVRWRTQLFTLQCLTDLLNNVWSNANRAHFEPLTAARQGTPKQECLFTQISTLNRIAFIAATSSYLPIQLEGMQLLHKLILDVDHDMSPLLEQHQASITSALMPALESGTDFEVKARAVYICGEFLGSGAVRDVTHVPRVVRAMEAALEGLKNNEHASLRTSSPTLAAWAHLVNLATRRDDLARLVAPHKEGLTTLWLEFMYTLGKIVSLRTSTSPSTSSTQLEVYVNHEPVDSAEWLPIAEALTFTFSDARLRQANVPRDDRIMLGLLVHYIDSALTTWTATSGEQVSIGIAAKCLNAHLQSSGSLEAKTISDFQAALAEANRLAHRLVFLDSSGAAIAGVEMLRQVCMSTMDIDRGSSLQRLESPEDETGPLFWSCLKMLTYLSRKRASPDVSISAAMAILDVASALPQSEGYSVRSLLWPVTMDRLSDPPTSSSSKAYLRLFARLASSTTNTSSADMEYLRRTVSSWTKHALSVMRETRSRCQLEAFRFASSALAVLFTSTASTSALWDVPSVQNLSHEIVQSIQAPDPAISEAGARCLAAIFAATRRTSVGLPVFNMTVIPDILETWSVSKSDTQHSTLLGLMYAAFDGLDPLLSEGYAALKLAIILVNSLAPDSVQDLHRKRLLEFVQKGTDQSRSSLQSLPALQQAAVTALVQGGPHAAPGTTSAVEQQNLNKISLKSFQ